MEIENSLKMGALVAASILTDPLCKVRECFYSFYVLSETCKNTVQKVMRIVLLTLGILFYSLIAPITAPIGVILRGAVALFESKPYIFLQREDIGKQIGKDRKISVVSHNQCYMPAGYSITDGQVTPPSDRSRMDANVAKIKQLNPDIICLYEVPDICDANYLSSQYDEYPYIIPVAGVRAIGPSSMMYVASKYQIVKNSILFEPFLKGTELTGRARFSEKGYLSFKIETGEKSDLLTVISTHLQHSEIPQQPTKEETCSRALQMKKIAFHVKQIVGNGGSVLFVGDLNQEETELHTSLKNCNIDWRRDESVVGKPTWGGDSWCAKLTSKPASPSQVLDYALAVGKISSISTKIIDCGFSGLKFNPKATSDHELLFTTIELNS